MALARPPPVHPAFAARSPPALSPPARPGRRAPEPGSVSAATIQCAAWPARPGGALRPVPATCGWRWFRRRARLGGPCDPVGRTGPARPATDRPAGLDENAALMRMTGAAAQSARSLRRACRPRRNPGSGRSGGLHRQAHRQTVCLVGWSDHRPLGEVYEVRSLLADVPALRSAVQTSASVARQAHPSPPCATET